MVENNENRITISLKELWIRNRRILLAYNDKTYFCTNLLGSDEIQDIFSKTPYKPVTVILDEANRTFHFLKREKLKQNKISKLLLSAKKSKGLKKRGNNITIPTVKRNYVDTTPIDDSQFCTPANIDFHDGYYLIWIIDKKGNRRTSIKPLRIADKRSSSVYNRWAAYFGM